MWTTGIRRSKFDMIIIHPMLYDLNKIFMVNRHTKFRHRSEIIVKTTQYAPRVELYNTFFLRECIYQYDALTSPLLTSRGFPQSFNVPCIQHLPLAIGCSCTLRYEMANDSVFLIRHILNAFESLGAPYKRQSIVITTLSTGFKFQFLILNTIFRDIHELQILETTAIKWLLNLSIKIDSKWNSKYVQIAQIQLRDELDVS